jgi:hypothetical protein
MAIRHTLIILVIGIVFFRATLNAEDDRIWLKTKINGKPVHLCFDSGSSIGALCPQTIQKLGLKFIPAPTNALWHGVLAGDTEDCTLTLDGTDGKTSFLVLDLPAYVSQNLSSDFDGLIGYYLISHNVTRIDAVEREITFLPKVPKQTAQWARLSVLTNFGVLDLQILHADHSNGVVCIDTGSSYGLELPVQEWHRWKESHPQSPITIDTVSSFDEGFFVTEEAWADQISVGPIVLTGVPIMCASPAGASRWGAQYEGTIGLAALKRLDLIVDGNNGLAYLRGKKTRPPAYRHNRLGAIFAVTTTQTNQAVARVVDGGPAYEAGVRNGDVLLQVDEVTVRGWTDDWRSLFYMPAGTKLKITLKRDGKIFTTTATLREILQPNPSENK